METNHGNERGLHPFVKQFEIAHRLKMAEVLR